MKEPPRWDDARLTADLERAIVGKLRAFRHPVNRYRLYRREELERLLGEIRPDQPREDD